MLLHLRFDEGVHDFKCYLIVVADRAPLVGLACLPGKGRGAKPGGRIVPKLRRRRDRVVPKRDGFETGMSVEQHAGELHIAPVQGIERAFPRRVRLWLTGLVVLETA